MTSPSAALEWLLSDEGWWLWSSETEREALRLLVSLANRLQSDDADTLQSAILQGPPREMFREDAKDDQLARIVDREVWLRLAKYEEAGGVLGNEALARLEALRQRYPQWRIAEDQRDEFPFWMGDGEDMERFHATPLLRRELEVWLQDHQTSAGAWDRDDWRERCKSDFPRTAAALLSLAHRGEWYPDRWREALNAWSDEAFLRLSWRHIAGVLAEAPDNVLKEAAHALSWWLEAQAKRFEGQQTAFFALIRRTIQLHREEVREPENDIVSSAINHPVGHAVQAALHWWYRQKLKDGEGLHQDVRSVFTEICDTNVAIFRYGRVLLGANVIALFRVDSKWTERHLLRLFNWKRSKIEAAVVWKGFLWTPRLYRPLISRLRNDVLVTALHYERLGAHGGQFAGLLTYAALEGGDLFSNRELRDATGSLPLAGKKQAASTLLHALEGAGEQSAEYWSNRVEPYIRNIWPKSRDLVIAQISEIFTRVSIAAGDAFPQAFATVRNWLVPLDHPGHLLRKLSQQRLSQRFPEAALLLLDAIFTDRMTWGPNELRTCLDEIRDAAPELEADERYKRLLQIVRKF